jgi:hypothetical protein
MRYLICLLGGVLVGALLAFTVANALQRRHPWPRALMNVMQHELAVARDNSHAGQCASPAAQSAASHLALLSRDIEAAMLEPDAKDRVFTKYADDLRSAISVAAAAGPDCAHAAEGWTDVSNACDACHRDYR